MKLPIYVVDAFTGKLFGGNPAAVCPLEEWLPNALMQQLAAENNLAETAFIVKEDNDYRIRWFTPTVEVKLCGHATLASAHVFYTELGYQGAELLLNSLSGVLKVSRKAENVYTLDFPADPPQPVEKIPFGLLEGLGVDKVEVLKTSFDYFVVLPSQKEVEALTPNFKTLAKVEARGVIVTAKGGEVDFVSRFFGPQSGIDEDPVTGSAHTALVPYWAEKLGKTSLTAIQVSRRRGYLDCELMGERVLMSGQAVTYMRGKYNVPDV
jgi:PhzF family phenazine biosynthesis protein